jgi:O-acetyl-ADP-ribose deacetylase (regulator of RNase III)
LLRSSGGSFKRSNGGCYSGISTVGPIWQGGGNNEEKLLENAYINSLKIAVENQVKKISFPNISTGVFHFPKERAAKIAISSVKNFLNGNKLLEEVVFVCFDKENFDLYYNLMQKK